MVHNKMFKIYEYAIVFAFFIAITRAQTSPTTTTRSTTTTTTTRRPIITTTDPPLITVTPTTESSGVTTTPILHCPINRRCTRKSPQICAHNSSGMCQRFRNVCHWERENCFVGLSWTRTSIASCAHIKVGQTGRCGRIMVCPRRPLNCWNVQRNEMCVQSANKRWCRIVSNACVLRNLNCFRRRKGNWSVVNMCSCKGMFAGQRARRCTT